MQIIIKTPAVISNVERNLFEAMAGIAPGCKFEKISPRTSFEMTKPFLNNLITPSAYLHVCISVHLTPIFETMIFLTFFLGLIANFIGYIPPGNINLTLVQITINRGIKQALQFIIAFSCVEFFFTFFIMHAAKWLSEQVHLDVVIDWVMVALFFVLGIITWLNRKKPPETKYSEHDSVKYGILLGFLNPMQIPFWMITGTYLIAHQWILDGNLALVIFSTGSAGGAFLCLFLYARFAQYIQSKFALSTRVINTAIAILFFAFAGYHVVKRVYLAVGVNKAKTAINIEHRISNNEVILIFNLAALRTPALQIPNLFRFPPDEPKRGGQYSEE